MSDIRNSNGSIKCSQSAVVRIGVQSTILVPATCSTVENKACCVSTKVADVTCSDRELQ